MAGTDQITQRRNGSLFCPCGVTFACVGCAALSKLRPFSLATLSSTAAVVAVGVSASSSWKCAKLRLLENMERSLRRESDLSYQNMQLSFLGQKTRGLETGIKDHTLKGRGPTQITFTVVLLRPLPPVRPPASLNRTG